MILPLIMPMPLFRESHSSNPIIIKEDPPIYYRKDGKYYKEAYKTKCGREIDWDVEYLQVPANAEVIEWNNQF